MGLYSFHYLPACLELTTLTCHIPLSPWNQQSPNPFMFSTALLKRSPECNFFFTEFEVGADQVISWIVSPFIGGLLAHLFSTVWGGGKRPLPLVGIFCCSYRLFFTLLRFMSSRFSRVKSCSLGSPSHSGALWNFDVPSSGQQWEHASTSTGAAPAGVVNRPRGTSRPFPLKGKTPSG